MLFCACRDASFLLLGVFLLFFHTREQVCRFACFCMHTPQPLPTPTCTCKCTTNDTHIYTHGRTCNTHVHTRTHSPQHTFSLTQMILKSPAVGANILKTLYTSLSRAFTHPKEALATLTTAIAAAISGACASLSAHMASVRAACATLSKDAAKRARTAIKYARTLLIQLQGLLLSVHKVLTRSPRQAAVLVYSVVMALLSAQGRWRSVQLVSYLVDQMSLGPLNLPSIAELKVKFEWWKYCAVQAASGGSFHIMRPQMVYVELLMQNLYKAASLPVAVATQALVVLHQRVGGKPSAAVGGAAVMKSLEGIARYAKMPALTSRGGVGSAVCVALVMAAMSTVTSPQLSALKDRLAKAAKPNADPKTSD